MKLLLVLLLALAGCGSDVEFCAGWDKAAGIRICTQGYIDLDEVEYHVDALEVMVNEEYPEVKNIKKAFDRANVRAIFIDSPLSLNCEEIESSIYTCEKHIGGANKKHKIYIRYRECLSSSSLAHELMHSIEHLYFGGIKEGHKRHKFFVSGETVPFNETFEFRMTWEGFQNLPSCQP